MFEQGEGAQEQTDSRRMPGPREGPRPEILLPEDLGLPLDFTDKQVNSPMLISPTHCGRFVFCFFVDP
jgi:hypothetical protein